MGNAKKEILEQIEVYRQAVNAADVELAKKCWLTDEYVSYIQPRGHEKGWEEVQTFYTIVMGQFFTKRSLTLTTEPAINFYNENCALVEFYWNFDATMADDGSSLSSGGRETQLFVKKDGVWKIAHVHYSNMPVTGRGEGF